MDTFFSIVNKKDNMRYTQEEIKNLFDSLVEIAIVSETVKAVMAVGTSVLIVKTCEDLDRLVHYPGSRITGDETFRKEYTDRVLRMFHTEPLENMPLYINDEDGLIAVWRLRIAR